MKLVLLVPLTPSLNLTTNMKLSKSHEIVDFLSGAYIIIALSMREETWKVTEKTPPWKDSPLKRLPLGKTPLYN